MKVIKLNQSIFFSEKTKNLSDFVFVEIKDSAWKPLKANKYHILFIHLMKSRTRVLSKLIVY